MTGRGKASETDAFELRLAVEQRRGRAMDVAVDVPGDATIEALTAELAGRLDLESTENGAGLYSPRLGHSLPRGTPVADSGIRHGDLVTLAGPVDQPAERPMSA